MLVVRLAAFILQICLMDASLLFRSNKRLEIPALKIFTNADMESLLLQLEEPKVLTFKGISPKAFYNFEKEFNLTYSAYVPKEDLDIDTFLLGESTNGSLSVIQETELLGDKITKNILVVFMDAANKIRHKRDATGSSPTVPPPTGPVLFKGTAKSNFTAMVYSSRPLLLKANSTERNLTDSNTHITFSVVRSVNVKLSVKFTGDNIFFLNFYYLNTSSWSLESVELVLSDNTKTNLTTQRQIVATRGFSYHCSGPTEFRDANGSVSLIVYDLQTQIGHSLRRFGDAYDCVPFVTAPIWSGLMVTFMLGIGLAIALSALGNIKTMTRYDSQKKGQLSITVFE